MDHKNSTNKSIPWKKIILFIFLLCFIGSALKFYHYNYIENTRGQARQLKLTGLKDFVCQGIPYKPGGPDHCGKRSIWRDTDGGITAYESIYGIETPEEARKIADFMVDARRRDGQTHIPMELEVFQKPRSQANRYANTTIFHQRFEATK